MTQRRARGFDALPYRSEKTRWLEEFLEQRGGIEGRTYAYLEGRCLCGFVCMRGKMGSATLRNPLKVSDRLSFDGKDVFEEAT
jgi:hypothetical protein